MRFVLLGFLLTKPMSPVDLGGAFSLRLTRERRAPQMPVPNDAPHAEAAGDEDSETRRGERQSIAEQLALLVVRAHHRSVATARSTPSREGTAAETVASG